MSDPDQGLVKPDIAVISNGCKYQAITDHDKTIQATDGVQRDHSTLGSDTGQFDLTWVNSLLARPG